MSIFDGLNQTILDMSARAKQAIEVLAKSSSPEDIEAELKINIVGRLAEPMPLYDSAQEAQDALTNDHEGNVRKTEEAIMEYVIEGNHG